MTRRIVRIGTRGSLLALTQSEWVKGTLQTLWPGLQVEFQIIKTAGDRFVDVPLAKVGGKGLFVKEIEDALLAGEVDLAVHSMKDVPSELPEGLHIGAIPEREDPRDVLISKDNRSMAELSLGAKVGTSSLRRAAQLRRMRSDLDVQTLRGNLDTRLRKLREGLYEAIVLAAAGLHRMGWKAQITSYLDPSDFVPAIGQGALGIEVRTDDGTMHELLAPMQHMETADAIAAERSFLEKLQGGCQVPIGGFARVVGGDVELTGLVASLDGREIFRNTLRGPREEARSIGRRLAVQLLEAGAKEILDDVYSSTSV